MPAARQTTDHDEIKRWVESHGGHPATVKRTRSKRDVGLIRVDFPGFSGEHSLAPISWDEWFSKFDAQGLAFLYQKGKNTNFNKLVRRDPDEPRPSDPADSASGKRRRTTRGGRPTRAASARGARKSSTGRRSQASSRNTPRGAASASRARDGRARRGREDLQQLTKAELYQRARNAGVRQRSGMNKAELVRALQHER